MKNRINLLIDPEIALGVKRVQVFMREKQTTQVLRWLIESSLIHIQEGKPSPIIELCHQNRTAINQCLTEESI